MKIDGNSVAQRRESASLESLFFTLKFVGKHRKTNIIKDSSLLHSKKDHGRQDRADLDHKVRTCLQVWRVCRGATRRDYK